MSSLHKFLQPLTQQLITIIHLRQARLMVSELHVKLVNSLRSTRSNSNERSRIIKRANRYRLLLLLDLTCEEPDTSRHLVNATNFANEGTLEGIDIGIQLSRMVRKLQLLEHEGMTNIFELHVSQFSKLSNGIVGDFCGHDELYQTHLLRAYSQSLDDVT